MTKLGQHYVVGVEIYQAHFHKLAGILHYVVTICLHHNQRTNKVQWFAGHVIWSSSHERSQLSSAVIVYLHYQQSKKWIVLSFQLSCGVPFSKQLTAPITVSFKCDLTWTAFVIEVLLKLHLLWELCCKYNKNYTWSRICMFTYKLASLQLRCNDNRQYLEGAILVASPDTELTPASLAHR